MSEGESPRGVHAASQLSFPEWSRILGKGWAFYTWQTLIAILKMLPWAVAAWEGAGREAKEAKAQTPGLGAGSAAVGWQGMENSLCFFPFKEKIVKKLQQWDLQGESAWLGGKWRKGAFKIREHLKSGSRAAARPGADL